MPNFAGSYISEFTEKELKTSGAPDAHLINRSADLASLEAVIFDHSDNLWVTNCSDSTLGTGTVEEFTHAQLSALSHNPVPPAAVTLVDDGQFDIFECPYGERFDSGGNLWVVNRFMPDLIEFTPSQLKAGGIQYPHTTITSDPFEQIEDVVFDHSGNLWTIDIDASRVYGFKAATLAAAAGTSSNITPDIINSSTALNGPASLVFDDAGNQWVANCSAGTVVEFAATDIAATGSPAPKVTIASTPVTTPFGSADSLSCPEGLELDKHGDLWVANAASDNTGSLAEFTPGQLAADGSPVPAVFLDANSTQSNLDEPVLLSFGPAVK
ncbi:MAG: hypothetical protein ACREQN_09310 [Candidatus Binataceae bacterium]